MTGRFNVKEAWAKKLRQEAGLSENQIRVDEPMSRHTTFRIGGPAELFIQPDISQLEKLISVCEREKIPWVVIGNGSNLLVGDGGFHGVVLELGQPAGRIRVKGNCICAEAGALLSKVANIAAEHRLGGMEFAAGIPGTIGGAVFMNAGAYGGEMKQIVESVELLLPDGSIIKKSCEEMEFSYRHSILEEQGGIVCSVVLRLEPGEPEEIRACMQKLREQRMEKQPLEYPSAGSTFKRPEGYFAGKLIMDAGLRGYTVGGAQISEKHCGFVINRGGAVARDVVLLTEKVQEQVFRQFGVKLELELRRIGEFV
ncbi:MAG: UDP-N-acetylmuramate dehydrogenase [Lachnospiraceae bacterium]|nr:UDP-N-acetylmuramate dehydrogenase [Lachnospiraceae bacterium]